MQMFFIGLAALSGGLMVTTAAYGVMVYEAEKARHTLPKVQRMPIQPPARLTRGEYKRLVRAEKKARLVRAGSRVF